MLYIRSGTGEARTSRKDDELAFYLVGFYSILVWVTASVCMVDSSPSVTDASRLFGPSYLCLQPNYLQFTLPMTLDSSSFIRLVDRLDLFLGQLHFQSICEFPMVSTCLFHLTVEENTHL